MEETQKWFWFTGVIVAGLLFYILAPVLTPFLMAAVLAYVGDPLVDRLETLKLSRTVSVIVVFATLSMTVLLLLLILLPMLEQQFTLLGRNLPRYLELVRQQVVPIASSYIGVDITASDLLRVREMVQEQWHGALKGVFQFVSSSGMTLFGWLANLVLIPVITFYMLRDWDTLVARIHELIPRRFEAVAVRLAMDSDEVLGAFLRGQVLVMLALGSIYSVGLYIVGLELALLIGMLSGLVSFVPYLGLIFGIVAAGAAALMQFQEWLPLLSVVLVFSAGQMVEGVVLTPLLVGEKIGLHPVAVIFAVLVGGQLFGFVGILLALPVAAVVMVLLRYMHERYIGSSLYGEDRGSVS